MRSLFLSPWHPLPADNGSRIRVNRLLQALAARHEVHLVTFAGDHQGIGGSELAGAGLCTRASVIERNPFDVSRRHSVAGYVSLRPRHIAAMPMHEFRQAVKVLADGSSYDLVIASTVATTASGRAVRARARVIEEHNFLGRMMLDLHRSATSLSRRLRTWLTWRKDVMWERRVFAAHDMVTMVSHQDRDAVRAMGCETTRIEVVPNGVDVVEQSLPRVKGTARLIYAGAVTYEANLEAVRWFATEVLPLVRAHEPTIELHVTGSTAGVDLGRLLEVPGVSFTGYLADVRSYVAGSQVAVVPLHSGGGTRLKALEAMALGTPVVSTRKGIEGLDLVPGVHCLVADDPVMMSVYTVNLLRDESLRSRISSAAEQLVRAKYDWRAVSARFVDLMEEVVAEGL